ncbi:hybrid sensor histidine kinase/response regulator transcription factor [Bacteroides ihuae]|uniref:hybrid sensor histidine kinase/response regulator transcription factor n=1 Tax=Bacteroides ihuae TaxID=1852362 RepID=UPI0008DAC432|nr:two-component regulator propeller domain-containing protein [Bacteroides ihuae]
MQTKIAYLLLFFCLWTGHICGQKMSYQIFENINLSPEASVISCFLQDSEGLVWVGSNKGLFSYDGYSAQQHFTFGSKSNTRIYCGVIVNDTYLYLGADNGVLIYNYKTDQYEEAEVHFPSDVRTIALQANTLWIGTLNGLYTYDLLKKRLKNYSQKKHSGLPHPTIYSIIATTDKTIYVGTYNGFCRYVPKTDNFERIALPIDKTKNNQFINSLLEDTVRHCVWVGTEGSLFKYIPSEHRAEKIELFRDNSIKSLALDGSQHLLVGTDNGLYVYHETNEMQHVVHDSRNIQSLSNNIVWNIFSDHDKNIWLGTDYGISMSRYNSAFQFIPIAQITGIGDGNHFYSIFKDSRNYYWFGGTNGLICSERSSGYPNNSIWYKMGDRKYPLSHNRIREIYEDKDHYLWIATDGSVNRYDYKSQQFIHYNIIDSTRTYNSNWVYHLFEDDKGKLWVATCLGGIFVVDKDKLMHSTASYYIAEENYSTRNGLSGMFINQIIPDHEGNVWVLLYNNGIDKIDTKTKKVTKIQLKGLNGEKSPSYILCDDAGIIWVGFRGGIMRINPKDNSSRVIKFDAFNTSEVFSMMEVNHHIWISTADGFWIVDKKTMNTQRFNVMDKIFTSMYFDKENNRIYLGSVDGYAICSPEIINVNTRNRPVILTGFYINNQLFSPGSSDNSRSIRYVKQLDLNYRQNHLTFEFSDFPYSQEEKNKFVYKLEGVDEEWSLLKPNTNRISYSNLPYGKYKLVVTCLNVDGKPSEDAYMLDVNIQPPWYYTFWAKSIYFILFVSLILWTINFFRVKNKLKIARIEKEKILEQSKLKIDFFTNVSHDFKTPLSMIIAPVSRLLLEIKNQEVKKQLQLVQRNAMKLNSLIHQVLDFNRVDAAIGSLLILSRIELVTFSKSLFSIYEEEKQEDKQLEFLFQTNVEKLYMDVDLLKLESILNNILSNAVKYTKKGRIELALNYLEEQRLLQINLSDTGIGIPEKDIPYVFQRFFQSSKTAKEKEGTGIGLYLVKAYVELHGGTLFLKSQENQGTTISITLPLSAVADNATEAESTVQVENNSQPLILIVDDNQEITNFIQDILRTKYRCLIATNGKEGAELCFHYMPNLIISDIMMPVMSGLEMCQQIKKNIPTSTIPIILLTAKDDKETQLESFNMNIDVFLPKPFEADILLSRIEQLLRTRKKIEVKARIEVIATPKAIEATSIDEKFLFNITKIIEDHISEPELNVNALSELSGINNKQIYRKIKQLTALTPVEYIKSIRMKKAAMLLAQKKFSVAEVMYMVGFSNHSYFSKCFQAEFDKTPRQFMEQQ